LSLLVAPFVDGAGNPSTKRASLMKISHSEFTLFGVGALLGIRPDCNMFLDIFFGYKV